MLNEEIYFILFPLAKPSPICRRPAASDYVDVVLGQRTIFRSPELPRKTRGPVWLFYSLDRTFSIVTIMDKFQCWYNIISFPRRRTPILSFELLSNISVNPFNGEPFLSIVHTHHRRRLSAAADFQTIVGKIGAKGRKVRTTCHALHTGLFRTPRIATVDFLFARP